jgi:heme/copper-type cytochrome/quinol oxidase subunit 3
MADSTQARAAVPAAVMIPTGRLAIWWFLASEVVIFGGLITVYVLFRWRHPEWAGQAEHLIGAAGALNALILVTSSFLMVLAHEAVLRDRLDQAARYLAFTLLGGGLFLCVKAFEYAHEIRAGFVPARSLFWSFYFTMTGLHALHVVAGIVLVAFILAAVRKGRAVHRVEYAGIYWHFVDLVWIFLFPLLYLVS